MTDNTELIAECRDFDTSSYRTAAHANAAMTAKLQEAADALEAQGREIEQLKEERFNLTRLAEAKTIDKAAMKGERDALRAQVSALQADAERMDWLDKYAHIATWVDNEPTKLVIDAASGEEFTGDTWREALDAARTKGNV